MPLNFVLNEWLPYCDEFPPAHILLRAYVGYKPAAAAVDPRIAREQNRFLSSLPVRPFSNIPAGLQQLMREHKDDKVN